MCACVCVIPILFFHQTFPILYKPNEIQVRGNELHLIDE